jgi:hypothetical protein
LSGLVLEFVAPAVWKGCRFAWRALRRRQEQWQTASILPVFELEPTEFGIHADKAKAKRKIIENADLTISKLQAIIKMAEEEIAGAEERKEGAIKEIQAMIATIFPPLQTVGSIGDLEEPLVGVRCKQTGLRGGELKEKQE